MRTLITLGGAVLLAACGRDGGIDLASASPFCQQVIPAVDAYMSEARRLHPTPTDDRYGGTVFVGGLGDMLGGMNTAATGGVIALQNQQFVNLMTLLDYDEEARPRAYLAETWDVSADNTEITFHIREDAVWSDGEPISSADAKFMIEAIQSDIDTSYESAVEQIVEVNIIDEKTYEVVLSEVNCAFLSGLSQIRVLPSHKYAADFSDFETSDFNMRKRRVRGETDFIGSH